MKKFKIILENKLTDDELLVELMTNPKMSIIADIDRISTYKILEILDEE